MSPPFRNITPSNSLRPDSVHHYTCKCGGSSFIFSHPPEDLKKKKSSSTLRNTFRHLVRMGTYAYNIHTTTYVLLHSCELPVRARGHIPYGARYYTCSAVRSNWGASSAARSAVQYVLVQQCGAVAAQLAPRYYDCTFSGGVLWFSNVLMAVPMFHDADFDRRPSAYLQKYNKKCRESFRAVFLLYFSVDIYAETGWRGT